MQHTITIVIHSDIDPSELLYMAQQFGQEIADEIECEGRLVTYDEDDVTVETK